MKRLLLPPDEEARLLAVLEQPDPPVAQVHTKLQALRAYLTDQDIRPGKARGIETCTLYRHYKLWAAEKGATPLLGVRSFELNLKRHGFRKMREGTGYRDRRPLAMREDVAERLRTWRDKHPDTLEDRDLFTPSGVRRRAWRP